MHCFVSGFWQPRPAGPWLHLLAPSFHGPSDCQRSGLIRKATDLRGDWSDWTHSAGWADLPYWVSGFCVPQTTQCFRGREPRYPPQALANSPWKVLWELQRMIGEKSSWLRRQTEKQHCREIFQLTQTLYPGPWEPKEFTMLSLITNGGFAVCLCMSQDRGQSGRL